MMLERRHLLLVAIIVVVCGFFAVIDAVDNDNTGRIDNMSCENFQHDGECSIGKDGTIKNAMGGTEIMHDGLLSRLPQIYRDNFSFSASRVRELGSNKKNILWLHDLPGDPEAIAAIAARDQFAAIVFVSEWQKKIYEEKFNINFGQQAVVLPNAIVPFDHDVIMNKSSNKDNGPIRLIYHTTPHRGLQILLPVFVELYNNKYGNKIHLDVYSSFEVYGWKHKDEPYQPLFDVCRNHPGCTYHGYKPNGEVREALKRSHIFAYPSIWPETSCIAAIEAMSAGVTVVTSQSGALPETIGSNDFIYPLNQDMKKHSDMFTQALTFTIENYWRPESIKKRRQMALMAANRYDWGFPGWAEGRIEQWISMLTTRMNEFDTTPDRSKYDSDEQYSEALFVKGKRQELRGNSDGARQIYENALRYNSKSSLIILALGMVEVNSPINQRVGPEKVALPTQGIARLQSSVSNTELEPIVKTDSIVQYGIDMRAAFWYKQAYYPDETNRALESVHASNYPHDDCFSEILRATYVPHIPMNVEEANGIVENFHKKIDELIPRVDELVCERLMVFHMAFELAYYDLDFRDEMSKWVQLYMKLFSSTLALTAPSLKNDRMPKQRKPVTKNNPIRVGFISTFFTRESSIWGNFGRTINMLQKNPLFEAEMIYYPRMPLTETSAALSMKPHTNLYLQKFGPGVQDPALHKARTDIVSRKYDVLVYLDMWMSDDMHRLAVAKLAPIQAYTHGHPITSGIPKDVMDYFISWGAAEQSDREVAQSYYTEELLILPEHPTWEYFEPRTQNGHSVINNGAKFSHFTRDTLPDQVLPEDKIAANKIKDPNSNIYFCAQAPFKFHFTFDSIVAGIQKQDKNALIILVDMRGNDTLDNLHTRISKRLDSTSGVDLDRIVFVPRMKHHHLMAMYSISDVVMDSVYFGGDTTSREAFEVGSPVITLPHKTVGQRWTQAYYRMMGIDDFIAKDHDEYVEIAVKHATSSSSYKAETRERIIKLAHEKLYKIEEGVQGWVDMFLDIATRPRTWRWQDEKLV
jgi:predicted O-linked N-acetylglucosamine transferase (SPINDLY family)